MMLWLKNVLSAPFGIYAKVPRAWHKNSADAQLVKTWQAVGGDFYAVLKQIKGE